MTRIKPAMRGIYQRGKIYWIAYKAMNRVIRESTGTTDRRLAEAVLSKRRAEVFEGRWAGRLRDTQTPLQEAIEEFLSVYSQPRKESWKDDRHILNQFATFAGPNACLQDIDRRLVERFQLQLLSRKLSRGRVNRYMAAIKCLFNRFIDWGKLQANPCRGIKQFPEPPRTHWLETGQIKRLLEISSDRVRPIIEVGLLTGLRQGDILRLTWDRIDFEQCLMRIVQRKTQSSLVLPVSKALTDILKNLPRNMDCPYVFHEHGKPLRRYGWVRTDFKKATVAAGLAGTRFHDLRHTAATQLRRLGKDLQVVQQFLGHKSIRMTLRYSHVHPTELREAVNRLGEKTAPNGTSHFTITSQSANGQEVRNSTTSKNDAKSEADSAADLSESSSISRPVNLEQALSEEW